MDVNALTRRMFLAVSVCGGRAAMAEDDSDIRFAQSRADGFAVIAMQYAANFGFLWPH